MSQAAQQPHPAIVVAAWNRPLALQRLLDCLLRGHYPAQTTLHISIDHFEVFDDVDLLADAYAWPFGEKVVEQHPERLGLREHMLHCGNLSARYGAIILLEDDLAVSPWMMDYAEQALAFFAADETIAGISLYNYAVTESCHEPFEAWQDGLEFSAIAHPARLYAAMVAAKLEKTLCSIHAANGQVFCLSAALPQYQF